jgi:hypothetical protein
LGWQHEPRRDAGDRHPPRRALAIVGRGQPLDRCSLFAVEECQRVYRPGGARPQAPHPTLQWLYARGRADGHDRCHSPPFHPACGARARGTGAGTDRRLRSFYSCFPTAVEIGCREIGLEEDDARGLTLTGVRPFFGGLANSHLSHAISHMVRHRQTAFWVIWLVTGNGNYTTKHSFWRLCATVGPEGSGRVRTQRRSRPSSTPCRSASQDDAMGLAFIETHRITHGNSGPDDAALLGRSAEAGCRFAANTPAGALTLWDLRNRDGLGRWGPVEPHAGRNLYLFRTDMTRCRDISYRGRLRDGRLLPHCCHSAVGLFGRHGNVCCNPITAIGNCATDALFIVSFRGGKRMLIFDIARGEGCSSGTGLCVRIFGRMGGFWVLMPSNG